MSRHGYYRKERIIPAYAGSTEGSPPAAARRSDHPRIRGEHRVETTGPYTSVGSSPHTRGAPIGSACPGAPPRIIPAYAGSTAYLIACRSSRLGSSPHTRGAPAARSPPLQRCRIIPAYAGSTCVGPPGVAGPGDHPRIRGEHRHPIRHTRRQLGSSPHTRGAPESKSLGGFFSRIIPAYAGSTSRRRLPACTATGSSPHTRGARLAPTGPAGGRGIIPAYAGST